MCTQKKNHEKRIKKKEIFVYSKYLLYLCTVNDAKPNSALGRFWRWHINFCPGWKAYFTSRSAEEQKQLREKYNFTKYQDI